MKDEDGVLSGLLPLTDGPAEAGEKRKVTPLFVGGMFGPQLLLMGTPEEDEERDPNP